MGFIGIIIMVSLVTFVVIIGLIFQKNNPIDELTGRARI